MKTANAQIQMTTLEGTRSFSERQTGRRRRFYVDGFQVRLLVLNCIYFLTILLVLTITSFGPVAQRLADESISSAARAEMANLFLTLHSRYWFVALAVFVLLGVHSLYVSHRIAGPLYRFRKTFEEVAGGNLSIKLRIRKHDYLRRDESSINEMIASLRTRVGNVRKHQKDVSARVTTLKSSMTSLELPEAASCLEELEKSARELESRLMEFQL